MEPGDTIKTAMDDDMDVIIKVMNEILMTLSSSTNHDVTPPAKEVKRRKRRTSGPTKPRVRKPKKKKEEPIEAVPDSFVMKSVEELLENWNFNEFVLGLSVQLGRPGEMTLVEKKHQLAERIQSFNQYAFPSACPQTTSSFPQFGGANNFSAITYHEAPLNIMEPYYLDFNTTSQLSTLLNFAVTYLPELKFY